MNNRSVCGIAGDGGKGQTAEVGMFGSEGREPMFYGQFGFFYDFSVFHQLIEPTTETHQSDTIGHHRFAETRDFGFVLHGFEGSYALHLEGEAQLFIGFCSEAERMVNREIEGGRHEEAAEVLGDGGHEGENLGVVAQLHALFAEVVPNVAADG